MKHRSWLNAAALALVLVLAASCLPGDGKNSAAAPAGFWTGIWHGIVAPISLVVGIFNKSIRVYETGNTGWWYDFGFYLALVSGLGGGTAATTRRKRRKEG